MKHIAYHHLQFPDGKIIYGPLVVSFDDTGKFVEWHKLEQEEPQTVWVGGTYKINES